LKRARKWSSSVAICSSLMLSAKPGMIGLRSPATGRMPDSTMLAALRASGALKALLSARLIPP